MSNNEQTNPENNDISNESKAMLAAFQQIIDPVLDIKKRDLKFRRWRWYIGIAFLAGILAIRFLAPQIQQYFVFENEYVSVVRIDGPIMPGEMASPSNINPLLTKAFEDKDSKGVMLVINSPGGTPVSSDAIRDRIIQLREEYPDKKFVVVGEEMLTSGAYWVATGSDEIYAAEASYVGSIGVIVRTFGFQELAERFGVERRVITAGSEKNHLDQFSPFPASQKVELEKELHEIHEMFIAKVKESRGDKLDLGDKETFTGASFLGADALKKGLIDGVTSTDALSLRVFDTTNYRIYRPNVGLGSLFKMPKLGAYIKEYLGLVPMIQHDPTINYHGPLAMPE